MTTTTGTAETTCLPAGRYEFKDAGIYIGEWLNEKAVGLGLITKDKSQGEYTGLWDNGMEKSGVFLWPNAPGAMYEGEWAKNRRNGYGVFTREDWIIMGKFENDFLALGVKCKENSIGRFEGEFENGFPSFGVETYADGGNYAGEYKSGIREGLGVRTSIPYGDIINFFPEEAALAAEMALKSKARAIPTSNLPRPESVIDTSRLERRGSLLSQRSGDVADLDNADSLEEDEPYSGRRPNTPAGTAAPKAQDLRMSTKFRCGFVLSAQRSELFIRRQRKLASFNTFRQSRESSTRSGQKRTRSMTNLFNRSTNGDAFGAKRQGSANGRDARSKFKQNSTPDSIFTLDHEDAIDPETVETFAGQWEADTRHGYGVCERSDGVSYEGQWFKNQRHGFGQTRFQDGTYEQGRYQFGKLVFLTCLKGAKPHLLLYNYHIRMEVVNSVKRAKVIAEQARLRATEAKENLENVQISVARAQKAAQVAREYSLETRVLVKEMYPDFEQPGIKYLDDMVRLTHVTKTDNRTFESAHQAAKDAVDSVAARSAVKQQQLDNAMESEQIVPVDEETTQTKGNVASRVGSYRFKRVSKRPSNQRRMHHESESGHLMWETDDSAYNYQRSDTSVQSTTHPALRLVVPQITKYDSHSPSDSFNIPLDGDSSPVQGERNCSYTQSPGSNQVYLNVPDVPDWSNLDMDSVCDSAQAAHIRVSRSPSVTTTYVTIPRMTDWQPEFEMASISVDKLLTNSNWMNDHFAQYVLPARQNAEQTQLSRDQCDGPSPMRSPMPEFEHNTSCGPHPGESDAEPPGLTRRRTVPTFLTQRPIIPKLKHIVPAANEVKRSLPSEPSHQKDFVLDSKYHERVSPNEAVHSSTISNEPISHNRVAEHASEQDIYVVDDGVRKRIFAEPSPELRLIPNENAETSSTKSPTLKCIQYEEKSPRILALTDTVDSSSSTGRSKVPSYWTPTTLDSTVQKSTKTFPVVVSNVLLEDLQDELPALPTHFKELRIDTRPATTRLSVPNVREHMQPHMQPTGLSPEELVSLSIEWQAKHARQLARQQQGELVIHLTDLWDWCNRNLILLAVLLLNATLAYMFAAMVMGSAPDDPIR